MIAGFRNVRRVVSGVRTSPEESDAGLSRIEQQFVADYFARIRGCRFTWV